jgi:hypothetical protein
MDNAQHNTDNKRNEIFRLVEGIEVTGSDAEKTVATALITKINILTEAKTKNITAHPTK